MFFETLHKIERTFGKICRLLKLKELKKMKIIETRRYNNQGGYYNQGDGDIITKEDIIIKEI